MTAWRIMILVTCVLGGAAASASTLAAQSATAGQLSIDQAVKMAEQRFHAKVVKAEAQRNGAQTTYVLRLLNDSGKVWTVRVDATSGAMQ